ncbi:fungal hydrophobin [Dendrothele bispora CBS 962.96]|uniref:Hydrophobin n=1 Tax=Dendrothele bispora (strain CBS 962.96) TaxID=1314807 RepID=A0A4S8LNH6_DENBC|nr:fungal hydrophobin [Dendrothele bispora CBS 962.96]
MLSPISVLTALLVSSLAVATGIPTLTTTTTTTTTVTVTSTPTCPPSSQCNTADIQCCNSVQSANSPDSVAALSKLGIVVNDPTTQIGLDCTPLTAVGIGGASCNSQPVCCENNNFNGLVAIGCVSINVA